MIILIEVLLISIIFLPDIRTRLSWHCTLRENKIKPGHLLFQKVLSERAVKQSYWSTVSLKTYLLWKPE